MRPRLLHRGNPGGAEIWIAGLDASMRPRLLHRGNNSRTLNIIDELKERHGLRNRSEVLMQLIEKGREATQQQMTRN
jgi:hypothetical protein